ncbi:hypothetical protein [Methylacidimicrobium sp. B4]|uniref:hypothetical protein n=1 Tax=Methylacidimicrobium sp. B4 TaxID=2796139 RepID=UPI001A8DADCA|nr:hypothetical protein [Methylacidimicrobium sp. B4]QSR85891.1 hypothetical protein MacB4_07930 [Methylacidimicrobium sp. B4]
MLSDDVATESDNFAHPMLQAIVADIHQSRALATLRDELLPKLISDELRVKDAEGFLRERAL